MAPTRTVMFFAALSFVMGAQAFQAAVGSSDSIASNQAPPMEIRSIEHPNAHTAAEVAWACLFSVMLVVLFAALGEAWDLYVHNVVGVEKQLGHVPRWIIGLYLACYILIIPGIFNVVFGISLSLDQSSGSVELFVSTQSMWTLIQNTTTLIGSILVFLYGIMVPVVKLGLMVHIFIMSETAGWSGGGAQQRSTWMLRLLSKWDSPKIFCYVAVVTLFATLDASPSLTCKTFLDVGFVYYSIFCIGTLLGAVALPNAKEDFRTDERGPPLKALFHGQADIVLIMGYLFASFLCLLAAGSGVAMAAIEASPPGGASADHVEGRMSLASCIINAFLRLSITEANPFLVLFILFTFVLVFPIMHMLLMLSTALQLRRGIDNPTAAGFYLARAKHASERAAVVGYASMLDMFLMGTVVALICGNADGAQAGISLYLGQGLLVLALAELVHWVAHSVINAALDHCAKHRIVDKQPEDRHVSFGATDPLKPSRGKVDGEMAA